MDLIETRLVFIFLFAMQFHPGQTDNLYSSGKCQYLFGFANVLAKGSGESLDKGVQVFGGDVGGDCEDRHSFVWIVDG